LNEIKTPPNLEEKIIMTIYILNHLPAKIQVQTFNGDYSPKQLLILNFFIAYLINLH